MTRSCCTLSLNQIKLNFGVLLKICGKKAYHTVSFMKINQGILESYDKWVSSIEINKTARIRLKQ